MGAGTQGVDRWLVGIQDLKTKPMIKIYTASKSSSLSLLIYVWCTGRRCSYSISFTIQLSKREKVLEEKYNVASFHLPPVKAWIWYVKFNCLTKEKNLVKFGGAKGKYQKMHVIFFTKVLTPRMLNKSLFPVRDRINTIKSYLHYLHTIRRLVSKYDIQNKISTYDNILVTKIKTRIRPVTLPSF